MKIRPMGADEFQADRQTERLTDGYTRRN